MIIPLESNWPKQGTTKPSNPRVCFVVLLGFPLFMSFPETIYLIAILLPPKCNHNTCKRGSKTVLSTKIRRARGRHAATHANLSVGPTQKGFLR